MPEEEVGEKFLMPYTNYKEVLLEFGNKLFNLHEGYMKFLRCILNRCRFSGKSNNLILSEKLSD